MYTVIIKYAGVALDAAEQIRKNLGIVGNDICAMFEPRNSYIDNPAVVAEGVYGTNVEGWGKIEVKEPYATTAVPFPVAFAQFKLALDQEVKFEVADYKEAFYYASLAKDMADQGFIITVTDGNADAGEADDTVIEDNTGTGDENLDGEGNGEDNGEADTPDAGETDNEVAE